MKKYKYVASAFWHVRKILFFTFDTNESLFSQEYMWIKKTKQNHA